MNVIKSYSTTLLAPRLRKYGVNKEQREVICSDVQQRLASLLYHWSDERFRRTLLTLGNEEAKFWGPIDASLDVRSLVVLGVRNSLIEVLNAAQALPDEEMPELTSEAINCFRAVDLNRVSAAPGTDLFGTLPRRFPNAWQCLSVLALANNDEASYALRKEKAESLEIGSSQRTVVSRTVVAASGIDSSIDPGLGKLLSQIQKGEVQAFLAPSFSRITRNPVKLLSILDHIVRHGATLVTCNYVLSGTYVARRSPLIRPAHTLGDAEKNLVNDEGLSPRHKELLGLA